MTQHAHSGVQLLRAEVARPDFHRPQFEITAGISTESGEIHARAAGELDLHTAPQLTSQLAALDGNRGAISLDLGRVTFIDLAGLRALLEARRAAQARDQQFRLVVVGRACARLLELTGTTELLCAD